VAVSTIVSAPVIAQEILAREHLAPPRPQAAVPVTDPPACASLLALQRSAGNAAVARLLDRSEARSRFGRALSRCACGEAMPGAHDACAGCRCRGEDTATALARAALARHAAPAVLARDELPSEPVAMEPSGVSPYDRGYDDGLRGDEPAPGPLNEDGLAAYDEGFQTGRANAGGQTASTPEAPAEATEPPQGELGPLVVGATALGQVAKYTAAAGETAVVGEAGATSGVFAIGTGATVGGAEVTTGTAVALSSPSAPAAAAGLAAGTVLAVVGIAVLVGGAAVWLTRVVSEPAPEGAPEMPAPGTTPAPAAGQAVPSPPVPAEPESGPEASNYKKWSREGKIIDAGDRSGESQTGQEGDSSEQDGSCDGPLFRSYPKCSTRRFGSSKEALQDVRKNYPANPAENLRGLEKAVIGNARGAKRLGPYTTKHLGIYSTPAKDEYVGTMFEQVCCEDVNGQGELKTVWTHNLPG
jgi:hypothetical protein